MPPKPPTGGDFKGKSAWRKVVGAPSRPVDQTLILATRESPPPAGAGRLRWVNRLSGAVLLAFGAVAPLGL